METWPLAGLPRGFRDLALITCLCHDAGKATPWFQKRLDQGTAGPLTRHAAISAIIAYAVLRDYIPGLYLPPVHRRPGSGGVRRGRPVRRPRCKRLVGGRGRPPLPPNGRNEGKGHIPRAPASGGSNQTPAPFDDLFLAMAVVAILRHHGPLTDVLKGDRSAGMLAVEARDADSSSPLARQWEVFDWEGFAGWLETAGAGLGVEIRPGAKPASVGAVFPSGWRRTLKRLKGRCSPREAVCAQLLYSLLIGCDKLDAALAGPAPVVSTRVPPDSVADFRAARFGGVKRGPADPLREAVASDVAQTLEAHRLAPLFTLTAPTGAGKTLTALETALSLASEEDASRQARIIYCLPFTSIVDQNFDVLASVLENAGANVDSSLLVKHHHLAETVWQNEGEEALEPDHAQLLIESWQSHIVVTTFVQLIESMLGNRNPMSKKLMQLPGAVVLLDEVQSIPRPLWELVREALCAWSSVAGTRFVLLTATRPLIFRDGDAVELCARKTEHFACLDRVVLRPDIVSPMSIPDFVDRLVPRIRAEPTHGRLIVVNTISCARALYKAFQEEDLEPLGIRLVYLSTHLTPRDRLARIREIRGCGTPCLVVSTQLVEAGVDISMDEVFRDLGPLDAIIQAAGRCNRSGERGQGRVEVVRLADERGKEFGSYVYNPLLLDVTRRLLSGQDEIDESAFLALGDRYFKEMWRMTAADDALGQAFEQLDFDTLGTLRLIKERGATQTWFVLADDDLEAQNLWQTYCDVRDGALERDVYKKIKRAFSERLIDVRTRTSPEDEVLPLYTSGPEQYDKEIGYSDGNQATLIL